jgi:hypothetical protein
MVGRGHEQQLGYAAPVIASRPTEAERPSDRRPISMAGAVATVTARRAGAAGHLERDEYPLPDQDVADAWADLDDLADNLVSDSERTREQAGGGHRKIQVTACDRQRPYECCLRIVEHRIGQLAPLHQPGLDVRQLPHASPSASRVCPDQIVTLLRNGIPIMSTYARQASPSDAAEVVRAPARCQEPSNARQS